MPHIDLPEAPGLVALLRGYPESTAPLFALAETVLRGPSPLTAAEREVIAAHVSERNGCAFCAQSHRETARRLLGPAGDLVDQVRERGADAPVDPRLRALLTVAGKVAQSGRAVTEEDVKAARAAGADDRAIHDTVLVAAMFCFLNRYVDGLATWTPDDPDTYAAIGADLAAHGYAKR